MKNMPVKKPYFSLRRDRENFWLVFCWLIVIISAIILLFFWDQTRTMTIFNALQKIRSFQPANYFFCFLTFLGNDEFYMIFFGVLIWCIDKSLGFWGAAVLLASGMGTWALKNVVVLERPIIEEGIQQIQGPAFPSGHTFTAVTVWGYLAIIIRKKWFWIVTFAAMILIPFSRIVLGYHYPGDILGGYAMGIPFLLLILCLSNLFVTKGWNQKFSTGIILGLCIAVPVLLTIICPPQEVPKLMGLFAGASVGYILEKEKVHSNPRSPWPLQLIKALIGLAGLFGIIMGLGKVLASDNIALATALRFFRYALGGIWTTLFAPALFVTLKLSPRQNGE